MRNFTRFFWILILTVLSCSTDSDSESEPEAQILNPLASSLLAPANNETCLDGTSINDTQSSVDFSWSNAQNALSYEIIITNLLTQAKETFTSNVNQTSITLIKAEPYSWKVKSIGGVGSTPSESEQWKFYLAGDGIVNYAPFPAELIFPRSGKNVTPGVNNLITLSWTTSDVDGDLLKFEVYLDDNDASTLIESIDYVEDNTSVEIEVQNNTKYYWKIISIDANGNQSNSGVYAFRTN